MSSLPPTGQSSSSVVPTAAPTPTQTTMQPAQTTAAAGQMQTTTTTSGVPNQPASSGLANGVAGATWSAPPLSTSPPASSGSATAATAVAAPTAAAAAPGPVTVSGTAGANASGATTTASAPTPSSVFGSYQFDGTTFASSANSSSLPLAEDPRVERVVLAYLKRRGFTQAEEALKQDAKMAQAAAAATTTSASANSVAPTDAAAAASGSESTVDIHTFATEISLDQHTHLLKQILHYSIAESSPDAFASAFDHLKKWMSDCIDVYRSELFCCLWPIYAHIFIQLIHRGFPHDAHRFLARYRSEHEVAHKSELLAFRNLTSDTDLQKCDIVRWFSQRKVEVPMSSFSHHLLVSFLEERNYLLLLKIVNDHLHIKIISRKPLQLEGDMSHSAINAQASGTSSGGAAAGVWNPLNPLAVSHLNTTPIRWGVLPEYAAFASTAQSKMRDRLREMQLQSKKARAKEAEAAAAEEKKRDEKKKADEKERDAAGTAMGDDDENESAKKRAKLDDGAAAASTGSTGAAASASADTEMADAADESAVAVGDEKEKKSKKAKKKEGTGESAGAHVHPLKETKEEKDAIEKAIKKAIRVPEVMAMPKGDAVKLPPIPPESQQRFLADLSYRQKLSSSSLPSVCFYTFLNSLHTVNSISISTDATRVSCALSDSTIRLYDLRDPAIRQSTNPQPEDDLIEGKEAHAGDEHASAEGAGASTIGMTRVITGSNIINRRLGDEHSKLPYTKLVGHSGPVYSTSLSPDGQYLLSGSEDCTARLWNLETKKNIVIYKGHNYPIWDVSFAPLGFYFATASHDATARLWCTQQIAPLRMFVGHNSDVDVVKFHPNCNYIATGSSDSTSRLWDIQSGQCVRLFVGHTGGVRSLAMDPEGRYAATGGEDGKVMIWDLGTGRQVHSYDAHTGPVTSLDYSADGEIVASGSSDYSIQLFEAKKSHATQQPIRTFHTKRTPVHYLQFTPRNLLLAGGVFNA